MFFFGDCWLGGEESPGRKFPIVCEGVCGKV